MSYTRIRTTEMDDAGRSSVYLGNNRDTQVNRQAEGALQLLSIKALPPLEVPRRQGESAGAAASRWLEIQNGCYGE
ncbi:MAG: hypothetical protein PHR35_08575 [Kiritimatiellae bacterium]|nr:hypothetical protein [Kiritimatiellia bacterium]